MLYAAEGQHAQITSRRSRAEKVCCTCNCAFDALTAVAVVVANISYYFTVTDAPLGRLVSPAV